MFTSRTVFFLLALMLVVVDAAPIPRCRASSTPSTPAPPALPVQDDSTASAPASTPIASPIPSATPASSVRLTTTAPASSPSPSLAKNGGSLTGLLGSLFPVPRFSNSWSTASGASNFFDLKDSTFRPTNVLRSTVHSYTSAPGRSKAMRAYFPAGSYTFGGDRPQGGFSFYAPGPSTVDLTTAKEATFGYSVYFPAGFDFQLGGKLPGLFGGNSLGEATGCSGGSRSSACFSARLMWREGGDGEFYTYLPPATEDRFSANNKVCTFPNSHCNPTYGASVGRGSFKFTRGQWTTVSERVRLNDAGKANGELELFVNGRSVISVSGLILRDSAAGRIRGMQMQTFFGGSKPEFASPKNQELFFSDFSVAITKRL